MKKNFKKDFLEESMIAVIFNVYDRFNDVTYFQLFTRAK